MATVKEPAKIYTRNDVFAAAVAAQRINGDYIKKKFIPVVENKENSTKLSNGALMRIILASGKTDILPEEYETAETIRQYFCSLVTLVFEGTAREFIKAAVDASTTDEITDGSPMFMLVASLPSVYAKNLQRQQEREALTNAIQNSTPLHEVSYGTIVKLEGTVIDSIYKQRFGSNAVNVLVEDEHGKHVVFFFDRDNWNKGGKYKFSGRVKNVGNQTVQLHYVRLDKNNG